MDVNLLIDNLWIIFSALLVFLMQAGFLSLEAGLTRSKNNINVAIKNISDFFLTGNLYFLVGYGIMYGESISGLFGSTRFLPNFSSLNEQAFFFFQVMFAATTVTIISGAIAERVRFISYLFIAVFVSTIIYPVAGHWVWAGSFLSGEPGWLAAIGFFDFAGGTVVHSLGGWIALALLILIGPRAGRYGDDGSINQIHGSNLVLSSLGALLLAFGWFGFNGGSLYTFNEATMNVLIVTWLGASSGLCTVIIYCVLTKSTFSAYNLINGVLVGLVAVTPGANVISFEAALVIGVIAALLMLGSVYLLDRFRIDDAVGAVPVHLAGGVWGTMAVAIFGDPLLIGTGLSFQNQLVVQLLGVAVCAAWGFIPSLAIFYLADRISPLRVTAEEERLGLNISEHEASTDLVSFLSLLDFQVRSGDTSVRAPVEPFTEVGQIAERYNAVMENLEEKQVQLATILENTPVALFSTDIFGTITVIQGTFFDQLDISVNHSIYALFERDEQSKQNILDVYEGKNRNWVTEIGDRYISFRCQPKKDDIGKIDGLTGVASDITEQRTSDVSREKYIDMLSTSAQISEQVTTILDYHELAETILPLLKKKYNLYHAAVLLLDDSEKKLVFEFGSDERAGRLKRSRESILVDAPHSIIARAARRKRVVLVNDVSIEPNFLPHPILTETKSELAVPLMVHNQLIGVLDIQENRINRFEETDVDLFVSIARQLAIAFNNALLFNKFQESEARLKGALARSVQSEKAKDEFLARVSHELRTPLGVILGYAEMLQDEMYGDVNEEQEERLEDIIQSSSHLTELVNQLLDSAKLDSGKIVPIFKPFDLRELFTTTHKQMDALAKKKGLKFKLQLSNDLPESVFNDPTLIRQMVINLVGNAIKFTSSGGVGVFVSRAQAGRLKIEVKDTGRGIPNEFQDKIFEAFQQVDGSMTREEGGTGLGLTITKRIATILGGDISLVSFEGQGSHFTIVIPFDVLASPEKRPEAHPVAEETVLNAKGVSFPQEDDLNLPEFEMGSEFEPISMPHMKEKQYD